MKTSPAPQAATSKKAPAPSPLTAKSPSSSKQNVDTAHRARTGVCEQQSVPPFNAEVMWSIVRSLCLSQHAEESGGKPKQQAKAGEQTVSLTKPNSVQRHTVQAPSGGWAGGSTNGRSLAGSHSSRQDAGAEESGAFRSQHSCESRKDANSCNEQQTQHQDKPSSAQAEEVT